MNTFRDFGIDIGTGSGEEVSAKCPQCGPTRKKGNLKSVSVNTVKGVWVCQHCDWRGSLRSGEESRSQPPKRIVRPVFDKPSAVPPLIREWFAKRGITEEVVARYCITLQNVYMPQLEEETLCIAVPYFRNGEVINVKYRSLEGKHFRQVGGAEKIVCGLDDLTEEWAVGCEGEWDKLALAQAGINNVFSVPDGAPPAGSKPSDTKFEYLVNCAARLDPLKKIILAVDNDPPGQTLEAELARRLGPERCFRVKWPEGCKDANDVLLQHGAEELRRCISEAKPYPIDGVLYVADQAEDVMALYREGLQGGVSPGWPSLDRHYTVKPGQITIVTGIPSHGKSQVVDAMMVNIAMQYGWSFAVCSPENLPVSRHIAKLVEQYTGQPFGAGTTTRIASSDVIHAMDWLHEHFIFIAPDETLSIPALLQHGKALVARHGIRGLVLDPWNEFDHTRPHGQTETEAISISLGQIRRFARVHGVHVWVVAHPQKPYRKDDGTYPVPTPYDISGSAHWRNKADNCLTIWRDLQEVTSAVQIHIQKIRFREIGSPGMVELRFNTLNGRYEDRQPDPASMFR